MIDKLTIYFPYYNQPEALINQLKTMANYNENIRKKLFLFIVDDGSQEKPALDVIEQKYRDKLNITLYRIDVDIPWNMPEANNLAFSKVETKFVIRTDIDHFFDEQNILKLLSGHPQDGTAYKFNRIGIDGFRLGVPPNLYLISKKDYWKTKGYNEFFSGSYGDDLDFLPRLQRCCHVETIPIIIIRDETFMTHGLSRDLSNTKQKQKLKNRPHLTFVNKDKYIKLI